jgi:hypothetical protein
LLAPAVVILLARERDSSLPTLIHDLMWSAPKQMTPDPSAALILLVEDFADAREMYFE